MAKTGYPNFALKIGSPWKGSQHIWSLTSSHSGSYFSATADQLSFVISFWHVINQFMSAGQATGSWVRGFDYYDGHQSAALSSGSYDTLAEAAAAGFDNTNMGNQLGPNYPAALETCCLLTCPVGLSSTGKPVKLRKYVHATGVGEVGDSNSVPLGSGAQAYAKKLGDGSMFGSRVLIGPKGQQGVWSAETYFSNHQMPRGRRKTKKGSVSGNVLGEIINGIGAAGGAIQLGETIGSFL